MESVEKKVLPDLPERRKMSRTVHRLETGVDETPFGVLGIERRAPVEHALYQV